MTSENRAPALVAALEHAIDDGYKVGAERIAVAARALAPVLKTDSRYRTVGQLRDAIGVERDEIVDGKVHVSVGIDEKKAFYGRFQEEGFRAVGRSRGSAGRLVPGQHFMRRAFDTNSRAIAADVAKRVGVEIDKANT